MGLSGFFPFQRPRTQVGRCLTLMIIPVALPLLSGCSGLWTRSAPAPPEPVKILVAQVVLDAPVSKSSHIRSFDEEPSEELDRALLPELVQDVELHAQRRLTEALAAQPGFQMIPFEDARRRRLDFGPSTQPLTDGQLRALGREMGADIVLSGRIHDYGRLRWQHWVTGWLLHGSVEFTIVGVATAWNPAAVGGYIAYDLLTDLPLWYGGAYVFGWAFRPVHVEVEAIQLKGCEMASWDDEDAVVSAHKALAVYPEEQRKRKEIQLQVHLEEVLKNIAETAGQSLRLKDCPAS